MKKLLPAFVLATALAALPLCAADSAKSDSKQRSVTTMGTVKVTIPADSAKLHVSLFAGEPTLDEANNRLDVLLDDFQAELKKRGFPAKAVVLENRDVRKMWDNSAYSRKFLGYRASAQVIVTIEDISKLSPLITHVGLREEYASCYPVLSSSKIGVERKAVLSSALRTAREKAEILAKEGGAKLGALLNASEEEVRNNYYSRANLAYNSIVSSDDDDSSNDNDSDSATPAGKHVISINVRVRATFALH